MTAGGRIDPAALAPNLALRWLAREPDRCHRSVRGALVFLDISGFTALSEALAGRGRVGAEEIRDVINATFNAILGLAYAEGGSLLKFGGDAVLLLFEADDATGDAVADAARRAASSARRMLDRLVARNPVRTSGGEVTLGATVGVHAGTIDLFLLGERHRELFVLGPVASETIRVESSAQRDHVLVSDHVSGLLAPRALGGSVSGARVLLEPPLQATGHGIPARPDVPADVWRLLPEQLRQPLREGHTGGQHRRATVAFAKVEGTDELLLRAGPAAVADELGRVVAAAQDACRRYDVTWLSSDVDQGACKIILVAGVPTGDDDDSDRIVHAAREVAASSDRLRVRVGVHRGPLFSGVVGPTYRLTYTILGDAVNVAARTMGRARPGQVLATVGVLNGLRTLYDISLLEPFHVKGKTQPVRAGVVGAELGVRVRRRGDDAPFVGRADALARLVRAVDDSGASGVGRAIAVTGPAGIGKSRLLDELEDQRPQVPLHLVACTRFSVDRPYRTIAMLLRLALTGERHGPGQAVIDAARTALEGGETLPWLPLLGPVYEVEVPDTHQTADIDPAHVPDRIRDVIGELLLRALPAHATVVVEDIQWMDPETRQMLTDAVARLLPMRGWTLLLTSRERVEVHEAVETMPLSPLSDDEAMTQALGFVDAGMIPFDLAPRLVERAGGNPLYLAELARAAGTGEMPDDVESLVRQRLDELPAAQLRLVQHAAVLGLEFPPRLLDAVADADERVGDADVGDVPQLLARMQSGYIRFRQSMYQEAAYEALPFRERQDLHRRAAAALARLDDAGAMEVSVEARSRHHHLAGDFAESWRWSRVALQRAAGRWALGTAIGFARRALDAAAHLRVPAADRAAVWEQLGDVLEATGAFDEARDAYLRARRLRRPSPRIARKAGYVFEQQGAYTRALRWYRLGRDEAETLGEEVEALGLELRRAKALLRQGRPVGALEIADSLAPRAAAAGDPASLGHLHHVQAWAGTLLGSPDVDDHLAAAAACFEEAGDLHGQTFILNDVGATAYWRGDWDRASDAYRRNRELLTRLGDVVHAAASDGNLGEVLADQGRFAEAIATIEPALRRLEIAGHTNLHMIIEQFLARAVGRSGDLERAHALYEANASAAREHGAHALRRDAHVRRAELAVFANDLPLFREQIAVALSVSGAERSGPVDAVLARIRGIAAHLAGDPVGTRHQLQCSAEVATAAGLRYEACLAELARGALVGEDDDTRAAVDALHAMGAVDPVVVLALGPRWRDVVARTGA